MICNQCGQNNPDDAAFCMKCGVQLIQQDPPVVQPAVKPPSAGMAIGALVCGILGFATCGIAGSVGVILGIVALVKINKNNGLIGGRKMAVAGVVLGGSSIVLTIITVIAAMFFPIFAKAKDAAKQSECINNLKNTGTAIKLYCIDYNDMMPSSAIHTNSSQWNPDGFVAFSMYKTAPDGKPTIYDVLCPYIKTHSAKMSCPSDPTAAANEGNIVSYYYKAAVDRAWFAGLRRQMDFVSPQDQVIFWEHNGWHWGGESDSATEGVPINMLFADGHAQRRAIKDSGYTAQENPPTPLPRSGKGEPAWFNAAIGTNDHAVGQYYDTTKCRDDFELLPEGTDNR